METSILSYVSSDCTYFNSLRPVFDHICDVNFATLFINTGRGLHSRLGTSWHKLPHSGEWLQSGDIDCGISARDKRGKKELCRPSAAQIHTVAFYQSICEGTSRDAVYYLGIHAAGSIPVEGDRKERLRGAPVAPGTSETAGNAVIVLFVRARFFRVMCERQFLGGHKSSSRHRAEFESAVWRAEIYFMAVDAVPDR